MKNGDDSAFPCSIMDHEMQLHVQTGLTKRELFSMAAMAGILTKEFIGDPSKIADVCVEYADALIAELAKSG